MNKQIITVVSAILAVSVGFASNVQSQTETIEAAKVVRFHDEIGNIHQIPIVKTLDYEQNGQILAIGGDDHVVRLWNVAEEKFVSQLKKHTEIVRSVAFSPESDRLATVAQDGQIHIWNIQDGALLRTLKEPIRGTRRIVFQPDGFRFAVCGSDNNVRVYDANTFRLVAALPTHDTNNETIAYSHDGSLLAAGGRSGVVRIWRTADHSRLTDIEGDSRRVRAVAFSPDDTQIAIGGDGPFITLWNPQNGKLMRVFSERPGKTFALVFCGNDMLASGESDNMIRLWNSATGRQTALLSGHTGTISTMTYEPETQQLISGSFDASVRFWTLPFTAVVPVVAPSLSPISPQPLALTEKPVVTETFVNVPVTATDVLVEAVHLPTTMLPEAPLPEASVSPAPLAFPEVWTETPSAELPPETHAEQPASGFGTIYIFDNNI